ncbi:MAG: hypothetical protein R3D02_10535 [Hyphomicrobiales bacterium]
MKVRGFRIELGDVEAALTAHPDVAEAAVIALPDPATTSRLHAFVLPRTAGAVSVDELLRWCRECLPDYMHPAAIEPAMPFRAPIPARSPARNWPGVCGKGAR